jgi:hypothetical protein
MSRCFRQIAAGDLRPGRYRLRDVVTVRDLRDEADAEGITLRLVDGSAMRSRRTLFEEFAVACDFPDWFGGNWDAFADCMRDLSWMPDATTVVLWQRSGEVAPALFRRAATVIDLAVAERVRIGAAPLYLIHPPSADLIGGGGPMLRPVR